MQNMFKETCKVTHGESQQQYVYVAELQRKHFVLSRIQYIALRPQPRTRSTQRLWKSLVFSVIRLKTARLESLPNSEDTTASTIILVLLKSL